MKERKMKKNEKYKSRKKMEASQGILGRKYKASL